MPKFGWLKSDPFSDPVLGELRRKGGAWRGEIAIGDVRAPLALPGSHAAPDAQALDITRPVPADYPGWRRVIGVPATLICEFVAGRRSITADTAPRLCRFFGLSEGYRVRAQVAHDTEVAHERLAGELDRIRPWAEA